MRIESVKSFKIMTAGTLFMSALLPKTVFAVNTIQEFLLSLISLINNLLIPTIIGLALFIFLVGLLRYIIAKDENTRNEAVAVITWGVVTLFVMVTVWGLVNLLASLFGDSIYRPEPETRYGDTDAIIHPKSR